VTLLVSAYPGIKDHAEKKSLLNEIGSFNGISISSPPSSIASNRIAIADKCHSGWDENTIDGDPSCSITPKKARLDYDCDADHDCHNDLDMNGTMVEMIPPSKVLNGTDKMNSRIDDEKIILCSHNKKNGTTLRKEKVETMKKGPLPLASTSSSNSVRGISSNATNIRSKVGWLKRRSPLKRLSTAVLQSSFTPSSSSPIKRSKKNASRVPLSPLPPPVLPGATVNLPTPISRIAKESMTFELQHRRIQHLEKENEKLMSINEMLKHHNNDLLHVNQELNSKLDHAENNVCKELQIKLETKYTNDADTARLETKEQYAKRREQERVVRYQSQCLLDGSLQDHMKRVQYYCKMMEWHSNIIDVSLSSSREEEGQHVPKPFSLHYPAGWKRASEMVNNEGKSLVPSSSSNSSSKERNTE